MNLDWKIIFYYRKSWIVELPSPLSYKISVLRETLSVIVFIVRKIFYFFF